ncbi:hypothetical protein OQA88_12663 [Cercophora sp. LCS_1]
MPPNFESPAYWETRFQNETSFEWLIDSSTFLALIRPYINAVAQSSPILHLGSGTSDLHVHLYKAGYTNITNLDYEPLALERGKALEQAALGVIKTSYVQADVTDMDLGKKFSLAIDKSTADAVSCGEEGAMKRMTENVRNHLVEGGVWVSMSFSEWRFEGIERWDVELVGKVPTEKKRETDPDIYMFCFLLRAK